MNEPIQSPYPLSAVAARIYWSLLQCQAITMRPWQAKQADDYAWQSASGCAGEVEVVVLYTGSNGDSLGLSLTFNDSLDLGVEWPSHTYATPYIDLDIQFSGELPALPERTDLAVEVWHSLNNASDGQLAYWLNYPEKCRPMVVGKELLVPNSFLDSLRNVLDKHHEGSP